MRVFLFYAEIAIKKRISGLITVPCVGKVAQTKQLDGKLLQIYIKMDEVSLCPHAKQRCRLDLFPSEQNNSSSDEVSGRWRAPEAAVAGQDAKKQDWGSPVR